MNDRALGGLFLAALGVAIAVLWYRGYFNDLIAKMTAGLSGSPLTNPFGTLGSSLEPGRIAPRPPNTIGGP